MGHEISDSLINDTTPHAEPQQRLWADALHEANGDETVARIIYMSTSEQEAEAESRAARRLKRALSVQAELASPAPSYLLWAIVTSLLTFAFLLLAILRGNFVLAAVTGTISAVFWWNYRRTNRNARNAERRSD